MSWVSPKFSEGSGLGNRLFQLAAANSVAKIWNLPLQISKSFCPPGYHGNWEDMFHLFPTIPVNEDLDISGANTFSQSDSSPYIYTPFPPSPPSSKILTEGLFQAWQYTETPLKPDWASGIPDAEELLKKWQIGSNSVFLHIRLGDYRAYPQYQVDLKKYYALSIVSFHLATEFFIFSDDIERAKIMPIFQDYTCTFVDEPNDVRALFLMSSCQAGGITANSTFSWWGAYFGRQSALARGDTYAAFMPPKWLVGSDTPDIYPPWASAF